MLESAAGTSKPERLTHSVNGNTDTKNNKNQEDQIWFLVHNGVAASILLTNINEMDTI
ncbi:MAG: hypothetical protein ACI8PP_000143 [Candidatus Pseudothioglobus sp.]|jgi:hypothetical protein